MKGLFDNDPALISRDSRGRFCSKERAEYERVKRENIRLLSVIERLKGQMQVYKRQAEISNDIFIGMMRSMNIKKT